MSEPPIYYVLTWGYFALWLAAEFFLIRSRLHWGVKIAGFIILFQLFLSPTSIQLMFGNNVPIPGYRELMCTQEMEKHQKFFNDVSTGFGGLPPKQAGERTGEYMAQQAEDLARSGCNEAFMEQLQKHYPNNQQ